MKYAKKLMSLTMGVALGMGVLAGCAAKPAETSKPADEPKAVAETPAEAPEKTNEPVTLKIYAQYSDDDTKIPYDYAVQELAKAYPNVKLELDIQAQDDGQKLQTYAATGNLPDIFQVGLSQIETFKKSGNIMVLNDAAQKSGFIDKVHEGSKVNLYNEDGNIYAFPYAGNELVVWYYNKELFEKYNVEVPKTYDELLEAVKVFKENDVIPMSVFAKEGWITTALYDAIAVRYDAGGIDKLDKGQGKASDEAYTSAAKKLNELVKAGLLPDGVTNLNYDQAAALFYEGKAAMFLNGQWEIEASTQKLGDKADWMYYPAADEASYEASKTVWAGGGAPGGYAVNPNSPNKELAAEVAAFISEKYCEAKYKLRSNPMLALKVDASITPEKPFSPMMERLAKEIPNITSTTKFAWGLSNQPLKKSIEEQTQFLCTPQYTAEEFIQEIDKVIDRTNK
ncbi:MAG: sugar transporter substrate-binding protein [Clostridia bacterium]|jgi:raffinose/stachyose/melibiose transport system substrate-binding protein|nr:sugar transporter substrate-binding protein [Clostridia bacterium]